MPRRILNLDWAVQGLKDGRLVAKEFASFIGETRLIDNLDS